MRVEKIAREIKRDRAVDDPDYLEDVFLSIESAVRQSLKSRQNLVFESTGLTRYFDKMLENLRRDFHVTTIGIMASLSVCLERVNSRDQRMHINISDRELAMINENVKKKNLQTQFSILNEGKRKNKLAAELATILKLPIR